MTLPAPSGADIPRDDNTYRLTYRDPTGETAVRNLTGRTVQVRWENGVTLFLDIEDMRPYLAQLDYHVSRKGWLWGRKKNAPSLSGNSAEGETETPLKRKRSS